MPISARLPILRRGALAAGVVVHVLLSLFAVSPGHLSVDEGTYHFMVRSWDRRHGLEIWNGYDEVPSPELVAATFSVQGERLVAVPPELYALLALPFYRLAGYRGLFVLNAVAFLALLALVAWLARRLTGDRELALDACLLLALGTFLWDYSQAAWPHATSAFFVLAAFCAAVCSLDAGPGWRRWGWAGLAGLVAGVAPGIRLDAAFALPVVLLPFLFLHPPRWRSALAAALGTVPGLWLLSALNAAKFGRWTPFTYGREGSGANSGVSPYLPLIAAGLAVLVVVWVASREPVARRLAEHRGRVAWVVLVAAALSLALPAVRSLVLRLADGALQLLVDLRLRGTDLAEPALQRSARGALIYVGGLKKSLLQSCPYLAALVVPAAAAWRDAGARRTVLLLSLVPAAFIAPYSLFAWHGGLSLNLRYFVPALPFLAILAALAGHRLSAAAGGSGWKWAVVVGAAVLAALFAVQVLPAEPLPADRLEPLLLDLPLALAAALLLFSVAALSRGERGATLLRGAAAATFVLAVVHAALVGFAYDARWSHDLRSYNFERSGFALPVVAEDSIFFSVYPDPYYGLLEVDRLRLAVAGRDGFADFRPLVDHYLASGHPVFASFPPPYWRYLGERGSLDGLTVESLMPSGFVARVRAAPETR